MFSYIQAFNLCVSLSFA